MRFLLGFAYITLKENVRRRSFYGVVVVYLLSLLFSRMLMEFSLQDPSKVLADYSYSFLSFFLFLSTLFIATDTMAKDIEKKSVYLVLSKGVTREAYLLGRAFGFFVFTLSFVFVLGLFFLLIVWFLNEVTVSVFRKELHLSAGLFVLLSLWVKTFLLSIVVLFFSTFMSNFFLVFLASVVVLIAGSSIENLYHFVSVEKERVPDLVRYTVTFLFYVLPSFSSPGPDAVLGLQKINLKYFSLDIAKSLAYSGFLLSVGSLIFRRRELA